MINLKFKKIDAFTKGHSSGNPAGYILLDEHQMLSNEEMQKIALELKGFVSEVGFAKPKEDGFQLKYYSSECEVDFCGHATIAVMYDLIKENPYLRSRKKVDIYVNAGQLTAFNYIDEMDAVYIMAPSPNYMACTLNTSLISAALEIAETAFDDSYEIQTIDGGLKTLIVPIQSLDDCLAIHPNEQRLKTFCLEHDLDNILIFSAETFNKDSDYRTRVFAPKFGYLEDPATGSGNAAFGYYLHKRHALDDTLLIEQSSNRENANFVRLKKHDHKGETRILFGGCATTRIVGDYQLHI
ncbi:MAG: PhzF family phenazine biosynthesis protein [Clostridia bacterium]|nr:PhzF family phenazine biosynthesis protein [Clostridia bacterium]